LAKIIKIKREKAQINEIGDDKKIKYQMNKQSN
jgi:hypothetical protein